MATKTKSTKVAKKPAVKHIGLMKNDAYLQPYEECIDQQWKNEVDRFCQRT